MRHYELTYIARVDVDTAKLKRLTTRLEKALQKYQAEGVEVQDLGEKTLAYPIHKEGRGHYFLWRFCGGGDLIGELEGHLRIAPEILRFLTVQVDPSANLEKRQQELKG